MKEKKLCITVAAIVWLVTVFNVNAYQIDCPKNVTFKEEVEQMPDGWEISDYENLIVPFLSMRLYHGKPARRVALVPAIGTIDGEQHKLLWEVNHVEDTEPYYIVCNYMKNKVEIAKKIDLSMRSCWGEYSEDKDGKKGTLYCSESEAKNLH